MKTIELLKEAYEIQKSLCDDSFLTKLEPVEKEIDITSVPTIKSGVYQPVSPQLQTRFNYCGRWENATHAHWLSIKDMEQIANKSYSEDPLLIEIYSQWNGTRLNWPNDATVLFNSERISIFAASDYSFERIYLLWFDCKDEPEFWVYDSNGLSRYVDFNNYLLSFINDDTSASLLSWIL